jgi:hypothetical protein
MSEKKKLLNMYTLSEINKIIKETPEKLVGDAATHYVSGSGDAWYLNPTSRKMEMVPRGANLITNADYIDNRNRVLAYFLDGKILLIPKEEIIELGYN